MKNNEEVVVQMKIFNYQDIKAEKVEDGAQKLKVRWLITKEMGAENFAMRLFEMESGGYSPLHQHPWEHEVFILKGQGHVTCGKEERPFKAGDVILIPNEERHQLKNTGDHTVKFICLIPYINESS